MTEILQVLAALVAAIVLFALAIKLDDRAARRRERKINSHYFKYRKQ